MPIVQQDKARSSENYSNPIQPIQQALPSSCPVSVGNITANMLPKSVACQEVHLLIKTYYMHVLESPPPKEWLGRDGTISVI